MVLHLFVGVFFFYILCRILKKKLMFKIVKIFSSLFLCDCVVCTLGIN